SHHFAFIIKYRVKSNGYIGPCQIKPAKKTGLFLKSGHAIPGFDNSFQLILRSMKPSVPIIRADPVV
ncbi:MAG: hypothetical protein PHN52_06735, partial [candidate division Zixibacteria bacterium]|nr:hypothetical protein [candidate division Zixibacteria bacterium]